MAQTEFVGLLQPFLEDTYGITLHAQEGLVSQSKLDKREIDVDTSIGKQMSSSEGIPILDVTALHESGHAFLNHIGCVHSDVKEKAIEKMQDPHEKVANMDYVLARTTLQQAAGLEAALLSNGKKTGGGKSVEKLIADIARLPAGAFVQMNDYLRAALNDQKNPERDPAMARILYSDKRFDGGFLFERLVDESATLNIPPVLRVVWDGPKLVKVLEDVGHPADNPHEFFASTLVSLTFAGDEVFSRLKKLDEMRREIRREEPAKGELADQYFSDVLQLLDFCQPYGEALARDFKAYCQQKGVVSEQGEAMLANFKKLKEEVGYYQMKLADERKTRQPTAQAQAPVQQQAAPVRQEMPQNQPAESGEAENARKPALMRR